MGLISYQLTQTSIILRVKVRSSLTGNGLTGLSSASTGLVIGTISDVEPTTTAYTSAGSTIQTIATLGTYAAPSASDCRFAKVDDTNHPGVVEIQLANARYAVSSAKSLIVSLSGVANMLDCDVTIPLLGWNPFDGVHGGMTAIPNVASGSAGGVRDAAFINGVSTSSVTTINANQGTTQAITYDGNNLPIMDVGDWLGHAVTVDANNAPNVSAKYVGGTLQTAGDLYGYLTTNLGALGANLTAVSGIVWNALTSALTTTGSIGLKLANWVLGSDNKVLLSNNAQTGVTIPTVTTAGSVSGAVGSVTGSVGSVTGAVGSVTGNVGGNVVGSVASVVGAVASVTGNVGGNVTGSVGSVVGAVGSVTGNVGGNVTGSVGSIAGISFPTHFSILSIDGSGYVTFNNSAIAVSGTVVLDTSQPNYAPSKAGDEMDLVNAPNATAVAAIQSGLLTTAGTVIDGKTIVQALEIITAVVAGKIGGAGTGTETFVGADGSTVRVTVTVDSSGNRTAVVYS